LDKHGEHPAGDEPEAAAGELARRCGLCRAEIGGEFFLLHGSFVCPSCAQARERRQAGRGKLRRALLGGAAAAVATALVWHILTKATGRPFAGFALVAGIAVGLGVQRGAGRRGGWRYQLAAVLLVYGAFVLRFVPPVFGGIAEAIRREHATQVEGTEASTLTRTLTMTLTTTGTTTTTATTTTRATGLLEPPRRTSVMATLEAYFVFTAIAWGLVLASPFMPGTSGLLPLLALAAGMALAFHMNRRVRLRGPYS
jgi:hypothetical protein